MSPAVFVFLCAVVVLVSLRNFHTLNEHALIRTCTNSIFFKIINPKKRHATLSISEIKRNVLSCVFSTAPGKLPARKKIAEIFNGAAIWVVSLSVNFLSMYLKLFKKLSLLMFAHVNAQAPGFLTQTVVM